MKRQVRTPTVPSVRMPSVRKCDMGINSIYTHILIALYFFFVPNPECE